MFTSGRRRRRGLRAERVGRRAPSSHGLAHGVSWAAGRAGRGRGGGRGARCGRHRSRASGRGGVGWAGEGRLLGDGVADAVADASRSERGRGRPGQDRRPRRAAGGRAAGDVGRQPLSPGAAGNWLWKKELSRRPGTVPRKRGREAGRPKFAGTAAGLGARLQGRQGAAGEASTASGGPEGGVGRKHRAGSRGRLSLRCAVCAACWKLEQQR